MVRNIKYTCWVISLFFCCYSCSSDGFTEQVDGGNTSQVKVLLGASEGVRDYSEIYVFNGQTPKLNFFHHKVLGITRSAQHLKMSMPKGVWNTIIVGCSETNIESQLVLPQFGVEKSKMPMWVTQTSGELLPEVPEIRTALINELTIEANETQNIAALLDRNVAKVRIVLKDGVGFEPTGVHSFSLKKVPTSLSWDGSLYPDKNNPTVSDVPMTKSVRLFPANVAGHQQSDTIDFIIPAHKSLSTIDTTTHKIVLGIKFTTIGLKTFEKDVVISTVPKNNKVLLVRLTAKGGVEVAIDVHDWQTVVSTDSQQMYTMTPTSTTSQMVSYTMNMMQERNWWVTLEDTDNFEFVTVSTSSGQKTTEPVVIQVKRKTSGQALSTKLNLFVAGLDGLVEKYNITDLIQ